MKQGEKSTAKIIEETKQSITLFNCVVDHFESESSESEVSFYLKMHRIIQNSIILTHLSCRNLLEKRSIYLACEKMRVESGSDGTCSLCSWQQSTDSKFLTM